MDLILNIYKEKDYTSFNTVRLLRKKFHIKRIGYIGTLDPFATGVLPVFTGNFTKLIPYIKNEKKIYKFKIQLGILTDTLDITGNIIEKKQVNKLNKEFIKQIIEENFLNNYLQIPPDFSAKKINGKRAYKLAREKKDIQLSPQEVKLLNFKILEIYENGFSGIIETSKGFYVRSFARDIAQKLSTVGIVEELERIQNGDFTIEKSKNINDISIENSIDIIELMKNYMKIKYEEQEIMKKLKHGQVIYNENIDEGLYLMLNEEMSDIIICKAENKIIKVQRVIR